MKIGVLTSERSEFTLFRQMNSGMDCIPITHVEDLHGITVDLFVRLDGWRKLPSVLLEQVDIQEQMRGLVKKPRLEEWNADPIRYQNLRGLRGRHADLIVSDDLGVSLKKAGDAITAAHYAMMHFSNGFKIKGSDLVTRITDNDEP